MAELLFLSEHLSLHLSHWIVIPLNFTRITVSPYSFFLFFKLKLPLFFFICFPSISWSLPVCIPPFTTDTKEVLLLKSTFWHQRLPVELLQNYFVKKFLWCLLKRTTHKYLLIKRLNKESRDLTLSSLSNKLLKLNIMNSIKCEALDLFLFIYLFLRNKETQVSLRLLLGGSKGVYVLWNRRIYPSHKNLICHFYFWKNRYLGPMFKCLDSKHNEL